jgi:hypothetical protein
MAEAETEAEDLRRYVGASDRYRSNESHRTEIDYESVYEDTLQISRVSQPVSKLTFDFVAEVPRFHIQRSLTHMHSPLAHSSVVDRPLKCGRLALPYRDRLSHLRRSTARSDVDDWRTLRGSPEMIASVDCLPQQSRLDSAFPVV